MRRRLPGLLLALVRILVGVVLLAAGATKLLDPEQWSAGSSWALVMMPESLRSILIWLIPHVEFAIGAFLLVGLYTRAASVAAITIIALFTAALSAAILTGVHLRSCGCFGGSFLDGAGPPVWFARNLLILAGAYWTAKHGPGRAAIDWFLMPRGVVVGGGVASRD